MHRTYIAGIESGGRNVTLRSITNLARALQVTVADLLSAGAADERGTVASGPQASPDEILLVEDNADDAELTLLAFKRANLSNPVKVVRDGREALDYLFCTGPFAERPPVQPQLVLLDLNLPKVPGLEVLRQIKRNRITRSTPVVVLTVSQRDESIVECGKLGAANYIVKPVLFESFSMVTPKLNLQWALVAPPRQLPVQNNSPLK